jgi:DNA-binding Xre family transcriptional regulator
MIGITHGAMSQLERGLIGYTQPMLEALAEILQCEPADLITRAPNSED